MLPGLWQQSEELPQKNDSPFVLCWKKSNQSDFDDASFVGLSKKERNCLLDSSVPNQRKECYEKGQIGRHFHNI